MTIPPKAADTGIYTARPLHWGFSCSYDTSYDISNDMTMDASSLANDFAGQGEFDISLRKVFGNFDWLTNQKTMFLIILCRKMFA